MPSVPAGARRTSLAGIMAGAQDVMARFRTAVFGTDKYFSPGEPLVPPEPEAVRTWDFPVGVNFIYTPRAYEPVTFDQLRSLAELHDITRLAIETRKNQIEKLEWAIKPRDPNDVRADADKRIKTLTEFWRSPDGEEPFATWLREALEDLLVIDAPCFEIRRNRGGDMIGLDIVDGATIKVLIDDTGRRPKPPAPAYEQVIHGRPWRLLTSDELLYVPRNRRPWKAYGFSPVEQILTTINIGLRRQVMQLQHFTDGNVPPGLLNAPDGWNAEQIRQFQEWFDAILGGNTAERTKLIWGPAGSRYQAFKEAPYKDEFDEWLARVVLYAFDLPPNAFVKTQNRSANETLQEAALEEGLAPLMGWVKRLVDAIIQRRIGHADLEFAWSNEVQVSPLEQSEMLVAQAKEGIRTRNEARDMLGLAPLPGGDDLMVDTGQGLVRLADIDMPAPPPAAGGDTEDPAEAVAKPIGAPVAIGLPVADAETRARIEHLAWKWVREEKGAPPLADVAIADLVATQGIVDDGKAERDARYFAEHGHCRETPIAVALDGRFYIVDGHHDAEGARRAGAGAIAVYAIPGEDPD